MENVTLQTEAFQRLREMIIKTELKPGTKISESSLTSILDLGRTPIRESLTQLKKQQLVYTIPQSGTYVSKIDMLHALDARFIREAVESEIMVELAAKLTESSENLLQGILDRQKEAFQNKNIKAYYDLDNLFHSNCYKIIGKHQVWEWMHQLNSHLDRFRWLHLQTETFDFNATAQEHQEILNAVKKGNTSETKYLTINHIHFILQNQERIIHDYSDYFTEDSLAIMRRQNG
ncbi:GntR family transcriptional regulator [Marinilactibacillus psychrotolerans]|uniref:GntR family transcriptional regulator n=1 Tax=Marinilactibacillus psychrotolerans TaxID=191770 RepID=A0A5R9C8I6_9LACT|nr:GntR family transcriptional regulator [Marinilactibacillus psychrotolerans]TLQ09598.1 GntR family transcriptional regulator [Marinilactibacillus psychrotolerans]